MYLKLKITNRFVRASLLREESPGFELMFSVFNVADALEVERLRILIDNWPRSVMPIVTTPEYDAWADRNAND